MAMRPLAESSKGFAECQGYAWPLDKEQIFFDSQSDPAIFYEATLEKVVASRTGRGPPAIRTLLRRTVRDPFYLVDASGCARIDPLHAECGARETTHAWEDLPEAFRRRLCHAPTGLEQYDLIDLKNDGGAFGVDSYRLRECRILLGSPLLVHGDYVPSREGAKVTIGDPLAFFDQAEELTRVFRDKKKNYVWFTDDEYESAYAKLSERYLDDPSELALTARVCGSFGGERVYLNDRHEEEAVERLKEWNAGDWILVGILFVVGTMVLTGLLVRLTAHP